MFRITLLLVIVVAAVLLVTNPGQDAHKQVVYAALAGQATQSELLEKVAADVLEKVDVVPLTYHNYYVYSTTTLNGEVKSVGALRRVWKWN
jgi:hypothetical protein